MTSSARCSVCNGLLPGMKLEQTSDFYCSSGCDIKSPIFTSSLNPDNVQVGDRVECDHYANFPALHGEVIEITAKGLIWVKLDIGGYKETYHPFVRKI